jgi:hypothetical protein
MNFSEYDDQWYEDVLDRIATGEPMYSIFTHGVDKSPLPRGVFYKRKSEDPDFAYRVRLAQEQASDGIVDKMIEIADFSEDHKRIPHQLMARKYAADRIDRLKSMRMSMPDVQETSASRMMDADEMGPETREKFLEFIRSRTNEMQRQEEEDYEE